jgi:lipid-A-disaccharide synthase
VRLVQHADEVAVVGLVEVLRHLPVLWRAMRRLNACLRDERPDLLVPIDYPDFNLRLAGKAARAGVPVVYYVSPQIWAWRGGRVHAIGRRVRHMMTLFPFETAIYAAAGVPATCVGYPGGSPAPADPAALRQRIGLGPGSPVLALLPGSRRGETARQLPPMLDAARRLTAERPGLQVLLPLAAGLDADWMRGLLGSAAAPPIVVHRGDYPQLLHLCDAAVVAAGTASLDVALAGLPAVVVYRTSALTYAVARRLVRLPHVALPNLIVGRRLLPELIQADYTGESVARTVAPWLDDAGERRVARESLAVLHQRLGGDEAFERAAELVLAELTRRPA